MAGKEIRDKIKSIKSTQKITSAMEVVAASKMRTTQQRMSQGVAYRQAITKVITQLTKAVPECSLKYFDKKPNAGIGVILLGSDRGLCGGLNNNLFRSLLKKQISWHDQGKVVKYGVIGGKAANFVASINGDLVAHAANLGDEPSYNEVIGVVSILVEMYERDEIGSIILASNQFINTMTQELHIQDMLPIVSEDQDNNHHSYIYEPDDARELLSSLVHSYVKSLVYQAVLENKACEMSARMLAMKNATDNAGNFIDDLQLAYNKSRQASITQELLEIMAGAAAV